MDREEYFEIIDDIRDAHIAGDMESVLRFSRELDLSKVKEVPVLEMIADAYYASGDIPAARDMLLDAYDMTSRGRSIAYKLSEICINTGNIKDAVGFYSDFCRIAPKDNRKYILKYKIAKAGGVESDELIKILEEYTSLELDEEYMYELARLYHEQGANDKCIEACDNLAVWYPDGIYLEKALELKRSLSELSPRQMKVYEAAKAERETNARIVPAAAPSTKSISESSPQESGDSADTIKTESVKTEEEKEVEDEQSLENPDNPQKSEEKEIVQETADDAENLEKVEEEDSVAAEAAADGVQLTLEEMFEQYSHKLDENQDEAANVNAERLQKIKEAVNSAMPESSYQTDFDDDSDVDIKVYTPETSIEDIDADTTEVIDLDKGDIAGDIIETEIAAEKVSEFFNLDDEDEYFDGYGFEGDEPDRKPEEEVVEDLDENIDEVGNQIEDSDEGSSDENENLPSGAKEAAADEPQGHVPDQNYDEEYLSDEMCEEVSEYLMIEGMEDDLIVVTSRMADRIQAGDTSGGNLIVTGESKSGKTYLTLAIIKEIRRKAGIGTGRVAKVQAESLNGKNIAKVLAKISGNDLVIENVGLLEDKTIQDLIDVLKNNKFDSTISLEDNLLAIDSILSKFPELEEVFENRIDIHELNMTQWAEVACDYAAERGYSVTDIALLALHSRIDEKNVANTRFGMDDVIDIIEDAIYNAEGRGASKRRGRKRRGLIELTEVDFQL